VEAFLDATGSVTLDADRIGCGSCFYDAISVFPTTLSCADLGCNVVTLTVDSVSDSFTCEATVIILDTIPAVAVCKDITVTFNVDSVAVIDSNALDNGSTDVCGGVLGFSVAPNTFNCTHVGDNTATMTVYDDLGNTSRCDGIVTIMTLDTTLPIPVCNDITFEVDSCIGSAVNSGCVDGGSYDNCGIDSIWITPEKFFCVDSGNQTITLLVKDYGGNVSTCQSNTNVTIKDLKSTLHQEDFETDGNGTRYEANEHYSYFMRANESEFMPFLTPDIQGEYYWLASRTMSGSNPLGYGESGYIKLQNVNVSGQLGLAVDILLGLARQSSNFYAGDYMLIQYAFDNDIGDSISNGNYTTIGAFYTIDKDFVQDIDIDGVADSCGLTLVNQREDFRYNIPATGDSLSIRIVVYKQTSSAYLAIDNIRINATTGFNICDSQSLPSCSIPTNITVSDQTSSEATISWGAVDGAIHYEVGYRPLGAIDWSYFTTTDSTQHLSGLPADSQFVIQVRTMCGCDNPSEWSTADTLMTLGCSTPVNLSVSNISSTTAQVHWDATTLATSYEVQYRIKDSFAPYAVKLAGSNAKWFTGLMSSTEYEFQVRGLCDEYSIWSALEFFTTTCQSPANLLANNLSLTVAQLHWDIVTAADYYTVKYRISGSFNPETWKPAINNSKWLTGLASDTEYEYEVRANCGGSNSDWSGLFYFTTPDICNTPAGLSTTNITSTFVRANWNVVSEAQTYLIRYRVSNPLGPFVWKAALLNHKWLTGLNESTDYEYEVRTNCSVSKSNWAGPQFFTTSSPRQMGIEKGEIYLKLFPNPTDGFVHIDYRLPRSEFGMIEILDVLGQIRVVHKQDSQFGKSCFTLDIRLIPGTYIVRLTGMHQTISKQLIITD
jgi:hypothetical protein